MYNVVGSDGQVYGPVDMATLQQWIREGRIIATTNLIDPLDGKVLQAQFAPALYGMFPTAAPGYGEPNPYQAGPQQPGPYQPGTYQPGPVAGYPRQDLAYYNTPPKSKVAAILLAFFLGTLGIHRFYLGHHVLGGVMLAITVCTCMFGGTVITGIWALIDLILIATGSLREANGRELN